MVIYFRALSSRFDFSVRYITTLLCIFYEIEKERKGNEFKLCRESCVTK